MTISSDELFKKTQIRCSIHFCLLLFSTLSRHICTKMQWQITAPAHNLDDKNLIPMRMRDSLGFRALVFVVLIVPLIGDFHLIVRMLCVWHLNLTLLSTCHMSRLTKTKSTFKKTKIVNAIIKKGGLFCQMPLGLKRRLRKLQSSRCCRQKKFPI